MKFKIVHEIKGRIRIHMDLKRISPKDADILQYYLLEQPCIFAVKVYERNQDAAICYTGKKEEATVRSGRVWRRSMSGGIPEGN